MSRFGQTEKVIFSVAILVLLAFSYFLYDDSLLFPKSHVGDQELIGDVSSSLNDVRRKNLDTFSWLPANRQDKVFQNDSIYTGDRSEALIRLAGGTEIRVQPNSLVTLNVKNGQMNLDLRYGNLVGSIGQGSNLVITSGKESFELQGSSNSKIEFKKAHSGIVDLKLLSGDVKYLNRKNNKAQQLAKNAAVAVSAKGDLKQVEKTTLDLKTADNTHYVRMNPDDPLPFAWQGKGPAARYELEISPTPDFSVVSVSKMTPTGQVNVTDPLAEGAYHWRVKALDNNGKVAAVSAPMKMSLSLLPLPKIVSPAPQAEFKYEVEVKPNEVPMAATEVRWQAPNVLTNFAWQISQDPEFQTVFKEAQTTALSTTTPRLPHGNYWVRVQGQTADKKISPWSLPVPFTINAFAKKDNGLERPILISRRVKFVPPVLKPGERTPASKQAPQIAWKPVLKNQGYQVEISKDAYFKKAQKYQVGETEVAWSQYRPGKYYYRVFAKGPNGTLSPPSDVGLMDIDRSGLTLNPVKAVMNAGEKSGPVEAPVSWTPVPYAKSYLVQVDKDKDFSSPQKLTYTSNAGLVSLPDPGKYNVRVQALDENNKPVSEFSNIEQVLYSGQSALIAPHLLEPFNNASIFLQTEMEPYLWLEWKKVPGATAYRIEISNTVDFSKILISKAVDSNRYLIKDRVPLGKIFWRVRAESPTEHDFSAWAEKREFTLYHQKNETFIK